ncbi:MAG TPA: DinB family protein [Methylomirabilota bacterium]|nr:DinB family protein [Methylomirabilota bacterium]
MNRDDIGMLYDYNYWANARVLKAAARVNLERLGAPAGLSHGSLRGTLVHTLGTEIVWRMRCQEGLSPSALPAESEFPTLDMIQGRWAQEERLMRGYLASLSEGALNAKVQYKTTRGVPFENVVWHLLLHVVNHGTQFRGEAAVALTGYDQSPGDLDMLAFLREGRPAA